MKIIEGAIIILLLLAIMTFTIQQVIFLYFQKQFFFSFIDAICLAIQIYFSHKLISSFFMKREN